jgi:hypothetical protein
MTRTAFNVRPAVPILAVIAAAMFFVVPARAQQQPSDRQFTLGLALGAAATSGRSIGTVGLGTLEFGTRWRNLDTRLDGFFVRWPSLGATARTTSLTSNLVYSQPLGLFAPYVLAGVGGYAGAGEGVSFGVNGGVGIKASARRLQPFVELREHVWSADRAKRVTVVSFGLMF